MVLEHAAASPHDVVQRFRNANRESLHAARERQARVGLHEEMEVVAEDGELDDAQAKALARIGKALLDDAEAALAS